MNETGRRKEWVKNVAIIFLAIMLVLTFFSNTIKNYSLPEVAAQYTSSGSITNKVRGSGTVEASDPYSVIYKASRKVASVSVRVGDEVQKGDVLYILEEEESEELKEAKQTLESMESAYEKGLVLGQISKDLITKVENGSMGSSSELLDKVSAAKKKVENSETYLKNLQKERDAAGTQAETSNAELDKLIDNMNTTVGNLNKQKENCEAKIKDAEEDYLDVAKIGVTSTSKTPVDTAKYYLEYFKTQLSTFSNDDQKKILSAEYDLNKTPGPTADAVKTAIDLIEALYKNTAYSLPDMDETPGNPGDTEYSYNLTIKEYSLFQQKTEALNNANSNLASINNQITACKNQIVIWNSQKITGTGDYATKIANAEAALEKAQKAYDELVAEISTSYDLIDQLNKIEAQKKEVAKLEKEQGAAEITAPVSGTVLAMNYVAGETIDQGSKVSSIQIAGKGYTLSFTVPMDKARLISVGDEAEITNSWWYSDVHARILTIRPDPNNPSQNKLVTLELDGDVTAGQSLSFSVGRKSANYDNIVPNSAIHEDNKGKFIYRINSKSTPLGNRYIIERVEVTVLASDDNQSAVNGALEGWDFIVTTSSKPIEDGTEVRLKD